MLPLFSIIGSSGRRPTVVRLTFRTSAVPSLRVAFHKLLEGTGMPKPPPENDQTFLRTSSAAFEIERLVPSTVARSGVSRPPSLLIGVLVLSVLTHGGTVLYWYYQRTPVTHYGDDQAHVHALRLAGLQLGPCGILPGILLSLVFVADTHLPLSLVWISHLGSKSNSSHIDLSSCPTLSYPWFADVHSYV